MRTTLFASILMFFPAISGAQSLNLSQILADSIGYVNVAPGVVLVEGEEIDVVCEIDLGRGFFESYRAGDLDATRKASEVTCVPLGVFVE